MRRQRPAPGAKRGLRVRSLILMVLGGMMLYVIVFSALVMRRIGTRATTLSRESQPVLFLFTDLAERERTLSAAIRELGNATRDQDSAAVVARRVRALLGESSGARSILFAPVPDTMRVAMARADNEMSNLEGVLRETIALLELGREEEARERLSAVDSVRGVAQQYLSLAQRHGLVDLVDRERQFGGTARRLSRVTVWWLGVGTTLLLLAFVLLSRRLERPLRELEAGFAQLAEGHLGVQVRVRRGDELGRLAGLFNEMTRILRIRTEEQGRFAAAGQLIAGIAHEVNNPLMAISAVATARLDDAHATPEARQEAAHVARQARRAGRLIAGLLRFIRPGGEEHDAIDLNAIVRQSFDLVSYRFRRDEVRLDEQLDRTVPVIAGDPARLEQIFVNLLSNALDALASTPQPRAIRVASWHAEGMVHVAVEDSGPGITPDVAGKLFHPFVTSKGDKGTGLGLYISREIARANGGDLHLASSDGGARFVVSLPAVEPRAATAPARANGRGERDRPIKGLRILFVEDEVDVRAPIARFLRKRGAEVTEAGDGVEALTALRQLDPDIMLTDLSMPRMNGIQLYHTVDSMRPGLRHRTVVLSGDLQQVASGMGHGTIPQHQVMLKPVDLRDLEERIASLAAPRGTAVHDVPEQAGRSREGSSSPPRRSDCGPTLATLSEADAAVAVLAHQANGADPRG